MFARSRIFRCELPHDILSKRQKAREGGAYIGLKNQSEHLLTEMMMNIRCVQSKALKKSTVARLHYKGSSAFMLVNV